MKFLADVNLPREISIYIANQCHEVKNLAEAKLREIPDDKVVQIANRENRIILSYDKDFLLSGQVSKLPYKAIVLHFPKQKPSQVKPYLKPLLAYLQKIGNRKNFIIIISKHGLEVIKI